MIESAYNLEFSIDSNRIVLYNTLSGSMDLLEAGGIRRWHEIKLAPDSPNSEYFSERGYLAEDSETEEQLLNDAYRSALEWKLRSSSTYTLVPTFRCNLRCTYCMQGHSIKKSDATMTGAMVRSAFNFMDAEEAQAQHADPPLLLILGGEPLLSDRNAAEAFETMLSEAEHRKWHAEIVTNGTGLGGYLDRLTASTVLDRIQITLDGPPQIHDARKTGAHRANSPFLATIENIKKAIKEGLRVLIRLNVDSENLSHVPAFMKWMSEQEWFAQPNCSLYVGAVKTYGSDYPHALGPDQIYLQLFDWSMTHDSVKEILLSGCTRLALMHQALSRGASPAPQFEFCAGNRGLFAFGPDGLLYPCQLAPGDPSLSVGRYWPTVQTDAHLLAAWRQRSVFTQPKCASCRVSLACGGGCAYEALRHHGTMDKPFCEPIEELLHLGFRYFVGG